MKTILVACGTAILVSLALTACGDDKDDKKEDAKPTPTTTTGGTAAVEKPESYTKSCASCHGPDGVGGTYKALKGTTLSEADFKATVKSGKDIMQPALVNDTEAGKIWKWATAK